MARDEIINQCQSYCFSAS